MPEIKDKKHKDFYEELRTATAEWFCEHNMEKGADYILLAPDFFYLLCKLVIDEKVMVNEKLKLGLAITYFLSPIDFIPESLLGTFGFIDDVALAAYVLNSILSVTPASVIRKHWLGKKDILQEIENILAKVDQVIGGGLWRRIMDYFDNPKEGKKNEEDVATPPSSTPPKLPTKKTTKSKPQAKKKTAATASTSAKKKTATKKKTVKSKETVENASKEEKK
jgi:uncharacterized membrane protein YkvA (DUF1232 family)